MTRVGIIGAGSWGKNHVRTFASLTEAELVAVADAREAARGGLARAYPSLELFADGEQLVASDRVDAVVIATPSPTHASLAREALANGKHVLVEKPLALETSDAEQLVRLADQHDRVLMVGHLMLYHPAILKLKEMMHSGELGDLMYMYCERVNLGVIREDENALWSLGPHDLSIADFLMDRPVLDVSARGQAFIRPEVHDVVFVNIRYEGGVMANVHLSWLDPHKSRRVVVVGSRKMAVLDDMAAQEKLRIYDKGADWVPETVGFGEHLTVRSGDILIPKVPGDEPLKCEALHFIDCIERKQTPRSHGEHGVRVVRLLESAQTSLDSGGIPVDAGGQEVRS